MYHAVSKHHLFLHFSPIVVQSPMIKYYKMVIFAGMLCPSKNKWEMGTNHQDILAKINV